MQEATSNNGYLQLKSDNTNLYKQVIVLILQMSSQYVWQKKHCGHLQHHMHRKDKYESNQN